MAESRNWYIILELEFDPNPVHDEAVISERIEEKKKFWSRNANNFQHKEYKDYLENIKKIQEDMLGENNIRAQLAKEACEQVYGPIDKTLKMIKKAEIPQDTIDKIATKQKVDVAIVKRRADALGIKIVASASENFQEIYDKYYKKKPANYEVYHNINSELQVLSAKNLYEFLYPNTNYRQTQSTPCSDLLNKSKEKAAKEFNKTDRSSTSGKRLCANCEKFFKDEASKKDYDMYLAYVARRKILDEVKLLIDYSGELTKENYFDSVDKLTETFKDRKKAESLLIAFCKIEKIPIPVGGDDGKDTSKLKICRCGCTNDISDGRKVCKSCGLELQIKCPKCGSINDAIINVCKCGFKFENIDKALALCNLASDSIDVLDFKIAQIRLTDAEKYWPGSERVKQLKDRMNELEGIIGSAVDDMKNACKEKKYFEARRQLESIKKFSQNYEDQVIEEEIKNGIETAEKYKQIAQNSKIENEIIDACAKAYEACNDCPGVKEIIAKYPPIAPTDLVVVADANAKVNVLSWKKSATEGLLYYSVVRKEGAKPISVQDGTLIGRVSMCNINDQNIIPGVQYYYAVFAERAGVYSESVTVKDAICNMFEISGVKIASGDGLLQIGWEPIADSASVNIERIDEGGKTTKLECNSRSSFIDKGITNDRKYQYKIYLTYSIGITKTNTKGICVSGIPTRPPLPIEKLIIKPVQGNEFKIEWDNPEGGNVQFFYSKNKPDYLSGDLVPVSTLESTMNMLLVNKTSPSTGTFRYEGEELIYVIGVVVKSGSAVIGTIARARKGGFVKLNNVSLVNGKILITLDLPKDATGFVVLYRHDQFPEDISDAKTTRKYIPLKQYQYDGGLVINSAESLNYYFSVFAEFRKDGESDYSLGTDYLFSNVSKEVITYSISVSKKLFGDSIVNITFESENNSFRLPAIDVISAQGHAPMFKKSGDQFYYIEGMDVTGSKTISIPISKKLPRETNIKPFFHDEKQASRYILKIKLGSKHEIS